MYGGLEGACDERERDQQRLVEGQLSHEVDLGAAHAKCADMPRMMPVQASGKACGSTALPTVNPL